MKGARAVTDDNRFLLSINNESNMISFFRLDLKKKIIVMNGPMKKFKQGNCLIIHKLS